MPYSSVNFLEELAPTDRLVHRFPFPENGCRLVEGFPGILARTFLSADIRKLVGYAEALRMFLTLVYAEIERRWNKTPPFEIVRPNAKKKPHDDRKPEDYMETAADSLELAKVLAGQGGISDHSSGQPDRQATSILSEG
jgi:hypothetical protein